MFLLLFFVEGCTSTKMKNYQVEIRVPASDKIVRATRTKLVLHAADALKDPNLSQSEDYILKEKTPLTKTLLMAAAAQMRAKGIEPLEISEAHLSSGRLLVILNRLEVSIKNRMWFASTVLQAEGYTKSGRLVRKWKAIGRGAHTDSRLGAGGAGLAMGKAISQALGNLPWKDIISGRPIPGRLKNRAFKKYLNIPAFPKRQ